MLGVVLIYLKRVVVVTLVTDRRLNQACAHLYILSRCPTSDYVVRLATFANLGCLRFIFKVDIVVALIVYDLALMCPA